jgi:hypothetical protein
MVKVIFVKKNGTLKNSSIKLDNLNNLYKKCLFSSNNNFESRNIWSLDNNTFYTIYSKNKGKAGSENKYELPPPIDSRLYFGTMVILKHSKKIIDENCLQDLTLDEWENVYNALFGGFEDIEDEEESDEEYIDPKNLTKQGYDKSDGFIVDDDDSISMESSDDELSNYKVQDDEDEEDDEEEDYEDDEEDEEDEEDDEEDDEEEDEEEDEEDEDDEDDEDQEDQEDGEEFLDEDYLTEESYITEDDESDTD